MLAACVTINVYFPAAAAEKAADRIIEDIWGPDKARSLRATSSRRRELGAGDMHGRGTAARTRLRHPGRTGPGRHRHLEPGDPRVDGFDEGPRRGSRGPFFASGAIGLTADGLVEIRDANAVPLADRNTLKKLVADDNADRNALYREIATANGNPEWEVGHPQHVRRALDRERARRLVLQVEGGRLDAEVSHSTAGDQLRTLVLRGVDLRG